MTAIRKEDSGTEQIWRAKSEPSVAVLGTKNQECSSEINAPTQRPGYINKGFVRSVENEFYQTPHVNKRRSSSLQLVFLYDQRHLVLVIQPTFLFTDTLSWHPAAFQTFFFHFFKARHLGPSGCLSAKKESAVYPI